MGITRAGLGPYLFEMMHILGAYIPVVKLVLQACKTSLLDFNEMKSKCQKH